MPPNSRTRSYITILLLLAVSTALAALAIWNDRKRGIELQNAIEGPLMQLRGWEEYCRQIEQARVILRSGDRPGAIAKLESAIALARKRGVLPTEPPSVPSEGEILLMELYQDDARLGHPHAEMKQYEEYMRSAYPGFPLDAIKGMVQIKAATGKEK